MFSHAFPASPAELAGLREPAARLARGQRRAGGRRARRRPCRLGGRGNAVEHGYDCDGAGLVTVVAQRMDGHLEISVRDEGAWREASSIPTVDEGSTSFGRSSRSSRSGTRTALPYCVCVRRPTGSLRTSDEAVRLRHRERSARRDGRRHRLRRDRPDDVGFASGQHRADDVTRRSCSTCLASPSSTARGSARSTAAGGSLVSQERSLLIVSPPDTPSAWTLAGGRVRSDLVVESLDVARGADSQTA